MNQFLFKWSASRFPTLCQQANHTPFKSRFRRIYSHTFRGRLGQVISLLSTHSTKEEELISERNSVSQGKRSETPKLQSRTDCLLFRLLPPTWPRLKLKCFVTLYCVAPLHQFTTLLFTPRAGMPPSSWREVFFNRTTLYNQSLWTAYIRFLNFHFGDLVKTGNLHTNHK